MNKDVIYIEPEDDITDIITKIEKSKEKIVALVPPKKAGVFRSIVNIKLIAKAGTSAEKSVVLVTVDPSIVKLAAATKLPVAKNLQSAPVIPEIETEETPTEQSIDDLSEPEEESEETEANTGGSESGTKQAKSSEAEAEPEEEEKEEEDGEQEEDEKPAKKDKKKKSPKLTGNKFIDWFKTHKKLAIFGGILLVGLIGFLVWALVFAPAVDISVLIKTNPEKFSEGITFTDKLTEENAKEGKFYLEQKKLENTQEVEFEATGQKNQGEKASGELVVYAYFKESGSVPINAGTIFSYNGLNFVATDSLTLSWDGKDDDACDNKGQTSSLVRSGCQISGRIRVEATNGGSNYNVGASTSGWSTVANVAGAYSDKAMSGGTDKIITVVQQSDIVKAQNELTTAKEEENKQKLYDSIGDEYYIIDSSFEQNTSSAEATPGADQEVGDKKPVLKATTTATVYVINKDKMKEFVKAKVDLKESQKVYDVKDMYIENFTSNGAKMKAQYYIGPKVNESEVVDKIKGKGIGDAQREIKEIFEASDVKINASYPWVTSVPGDSNKIKMTFEVKDQDGNEVKEQVDDEKTDNNDTNKDNKDDK